MARKQPKNAFFGSDHQPKLTSNLEVPHHPHVEKKKFREYLLEFLMIFLAVTMGFFAECLRERNVDNEKEKHYMESLVQDLKKDTAEMNNVYSIPTIFVKKMDSALHIPVEKLTDIDQQDSFYHHLIYFYSWVYIFYQNSNSLTQLRNAGGLSVIRKKQVVDATGELQLDYDQNVRMNGDYYNDFWKKVVDVSSRLVICPEPPVLLSDPMFQIYLRHVEVFTRYEPPLLQELYCDIRNEKGTLLVYMNYEAGYLERTKKLIGLVQKEYQVENE